MKPLFNWTPKKIAEALRLQQEGWSLGEIAREFGVTRNTICGKVYRAKVAQGLLDPPSPKKRRVTVSTVPKRQYTRKEAMLSLPERAGSISPHLTPSTPAPDLGQLASILDVTGCKWPVKDDAAFVGGVAFCNHAQDENSAYCPYHRQMSVAHYSRELILKTTKSALAKYKEAA